MLTDQGRHDAEWVLQSIRFGRADASRAIRYPVRQHFGGLEIRTSSPVFDPERFTMMDFRVKQQDGVSFVYILPFAPDRALVEHTVFSTTPLSPQTHYTLTDQYISERFGVDYVVERHEFGDLPMDDRAPDQQASTRVFNVGIVGGHIKPSTGYTFARVQRRTQVMAQVYAQTGRLKRVPSNPLRFAFYDRLLLRILHGRPDVGLAVFQALFRRNDIDRVLRFLDERTRLSEELSMFLKLPFWPFVSGLPALTPHHHPVADDDSACRSRPRAHDHRELAAGHGCRARRMEPRHRQPAVRRTVDCDHRLPEYRRVHHGTRVHAWACGTWLSPNQPHHRAIRDLDLCRTELRHPQPRASHPPCSARNRGRSDYHRGSPSLPRWYLDFMGQYPPGNSGRGCPC